MCESCKKNKLVLDISKLSYPEIIVSIEYFTGLGFKYEGVDGFNDIYHSNNSIVVDTRESIVYLDCEAYDESVDIVEYISEHNYEIILGVIANWDVVNRESLLNAFEYVSTVLFDSDANYSVRNLKTLRKVVICAKSGLNKKIVEAMLSNDQIKKYLVSVRGNKYAFLI
jgi:hypothetical protein